MFLHFPLFSELRAVHFLHGFDLQRSSSSYALKVGNCASYILGMIVNCHNRTCTFGDLGFPQESRRSAGNSAVPYF
jgi:hypothetical protein